MAHEINKKSPEQKYSDLADLPLADMAEFEAAHSRGTGPSWDESVYLGNTALEDIEKPVTELSARRTERAIARQEAREAQLLNDLREQDIRPSPHYRDRG